MTTVKRFRILVLVFITLAYPLTVSSRPLPLSVVPVYYTIHLKNGGKLVIGRYWRRGNTIMFPLYGGVAGVEKQAVGRIVEITYRAREKSSVGRNQIGAQKIPGIGPAR
jgi:hypothetical protein